VYPLLADKSGKDVYRMQEINTICIVCFPEVSILFDNLKENKILKLKQVYAYDGEEHRQ